ncbi:MAG: alpha/beta fold hydrolase [Bacteroidia bacterium]
MPFVKSTYSRPWYMVHPHLETVYPNRFRPAPRPSYVRKRLELEDGDFMDLDWLRSGSNKRLALLAHGLEGDSNRPYMRGMASAFFRQGWDVLAWNCRSCSGEMNRNFCLYHHGVSHDLEAVIEAVGDGYDEISLTGFSMGGAIVLKYLGEKGEQVPPNIKTATAISTPCHLPDSVRATQAKGNGIYVYFFLKQLGEKVIQKAMQFPERLDPSALKHIKTLWEFADIYTAPMYGFENGEAFFEGVNAFPHLSNIRVPTLILNAANDPMLEGNCYPENLAARHDFIHLESPDTGGHVGFLKGTGMTYSELRAVAWASQG